MFFARTKGSSTTVEVGSVIKIVVFGTTTWGIVRRIVRGIVEFYCKSLGGDIWSCSIDEFEIIKVPAQIIADDFGDWFWEDPAVYEPLGLKPPIKVGSVIETNDDGRLDRGIVSDIVLEAGDVLEYYSVKFGGKNCFCPKSKSKCINVPAKDIANQFEDWFWEDDQYCGSVGLTLSDRDTSN